MMRASGSGSLRSIAILPEWVRSSVAEHCYRNTLMPLGLPSSPALLDLRLADDSSSEPFLSDESSLRRSSLGPMHSASR